MHRSAKGTWEPGAGARFGPYVIVQPVGRGGYATVFLAKDTLFNRPVALKVVCRPEMAAECARQFARQVGTVAARLAHPNIVRILGSGEEDGVPYLAMEFVDGESLSRHLLRQHHLGWRDALSIVRDITAGLAAAHCAGVLHRDVKPDNILVTRDGLAKLTDFYADDPESLLNEEGVFDYFGTPGYSSPEQVRGREDLIDGRADLYAVGLVLYEMLEGRPFHGRGETRRLVARTLSPWRAPALRTSGSVPRPVVRLCRRLLHRNPRRRAADAVAVLEAVEGILQHGGTS